MSPTLDDIRLAATRLDGHIRRTPFAPARTLSALTGAEVFLKFENLQFTASFKERGALNRLLDLTPEERARGVIAMSAGNHAQGVAYHARRLGVPAVIVMPRHTPDVKVEHTRDHGAEVVLHGDTFHEAAAHARRLRAERDLVLVHPFDDPAVVAGQGTLGLEMIEQRPEIDTLIVPIGGGGLLAGIAVAVKALRPDIRLVGVQSERFPAMAARLRGETAVCADYTVAEGIAVREPGEITASILRGRLEDIILVGERELEDAILLLLQIEKTLVEGAGAAGLAALLKERTRFAGRRVGLLLCGGNLDLTSMAAIIQRGLIRGGQIAALRVETRDVPGALARISACIGDQGGNIMEVGHRRGFGDQPLQMVTVDFLVRTRGPAHSATIIAAIEAAGCRVSRVP